MLLLCVSLCSVCMAVILLMPWCLRSWFVLSVASLSVFVVLLVLFVLFATFAGGFYYLFRVVMCAWRLYWSCIGVCGRSSLCPLIMCLCCLLCCVCFVCYD